MKNVSLAQKITESGLMIALATILSIVKLVDLPYGGSITFASMLPVMLIAYRYSMSWGLFTGFTYGVLQLLLGSSALSYATSWNAAAAIILLDYIIAFTAVGIAGCFKKIMKNPAALGMGALASCVLRYILHVISGCTVWAGLSIPTSGALIYSLIYNATYMLPETIVTVVAAVYVSSVIDFSRPRLSPAKQEAVTKTERILNAAAGFVSVVAIAVISALVFPHLQNAETGEFDITGITAVNTSALIWTAAISVVVIAILLTIKKAYKAKD